jgi:hypothetical protein
MDLMEISSPMHHTIERRESAVLASNDSHDAIATYASLLTESLGRIDAIKKEYELAKVGGRSTTQKGNEPANSNSLTGKSNKYVSKYGKTSNKKAWAQGTGFGGTDDGIENDRARIAEAKELEGRLDEEVATALSTLNTTIRCLRDEMNDPTSQYVLDMRARFAAKGLRICEWAGACHFFVLFTDSACYLLSGYQACAGCLNLICAMIVWWTLVPEKWPIKNYLFSSQLWGKVMFSPIC